MRVWKGPYSNYAGEAALKQDSGKPGHVVTLRTLQSVRVGLQFS